MTATQVLSMAFVILEGCALALALVGSGAALAAGPDYAASVNPWGVPRWAPAAMAMILSLVSAVTWSGHGRFRLIALFWAWGAAAFARPGLREIGLHVRLEWVCLVLAVALAASAILSTNSSAVRRAFWAAVLSFGVMAAAIVLPKTWPVDWPAYATILALAALSPWARWKHRRQA